MNITISGNLNRDSCGYVIRNLLNILSDHIVDICPRGDIVYSTNAEIDYIETKIKKDHIYKHIHLIVGNGNTYVPVPAYKTIYYLFHDYEIIPSSIEKNMSDVDEIWVPSMWLKRNVEKCINKPCYHIPYAVNSELINNVRQYPSNNICKFLTIANWELRKNTSDIIKAYCRAFENTEPVCLCFYGFKNNKFDDKYEIQWLAERQHKLHNSNHIYINEPVTLSLEQNYLHSDIEYYNFLNSFDVGVFPYRTDAAHIAMIQMMALKKPCMAINYSSAKEIATSENSYMIKEFSETPAIDSNIALNGDMGNWAKPSIDELSYQFRKIYEEQKTENQNKIKEMARYSAIQLNFELTRKRINERLGV